MDLGLHFSSLPGCCRSPLAGRAQLCDHSTKICPLVQNFLQLLIPAQFSQSPSLLPPQVQLFPQCSSGQSHRGVILASQSSSRQSQSLLLFSIYSEQFPACLTPHPTGTSIPAGAEGHWGAGTSFAPPLPPPSTLSHPPCSHQVPAGIIPPEPHPTHPSLSPHACRVVATLPQSPPSLLPPSPWPGALGRMSDQESTLFSCPAGWY